MWPVFWSFRIMVAIGLLMAFAGLWGIVLHWRGRLYTTRWFLRLWTLMIPSGFVAVLLGWMVAEIGRQPYVVYGFLRTADALSPVPGGAVLSSLATFVVAYAIIFGAGITYMVRLLRKGPEALAGDQPKDPRAARPLSGAPAGIAAR